MQSVMQRIRRIEWGEVKRNCRNTFTKLIRTRDPRDSDGIEISLPGKQRLSRCLNTIDLTSLGVGSCVGTGMYLVSGMVARKFAGPGVILSFMIAALASVFSGVCYAEYGVRVPNTTGSAYSYTYVSVGEFIAFVVGWNMLLEYVIGTSACARALSSCFNSVFNRAITDYITTTVGTFYGSPPDFIAFAITLSMMLVLMAGVKKSVYFNHILNGINACIWVYIIAAGLFYIDFENWTGPQGFLPFGMTGVLSGAATCFYAFIGFDVVATTGAEAHDPKRSIPLSIMLSLGIALLAYVSTSAILTLIVPFDQVDPDAALLQMFDSVGSPTSKYIVVIGAIAGLTAAMFGSMFPMPRVIYAMASDGLIFKQLAKISEKTGTPISAIVLGSTIASFFALFINLDILVEIMSIGTLLAYTLVCTCVKVLRYQPNSTNLIELLPHCLRTPVDPEDNAQRETSFGGAGASVPPSQRIMVRRLTRSSPDSDDSVRGDDSEESGRDDTFLMSPNGENNFYGARAVGSSANPGFFSRFWGALYRQLYAMSYICPGICPWVEYGVPTEASGMYVMKCVGIFYLLAIPFNFLAVYGNPGESTATAVFMSFLFLGIMVVLLLISRKPQNRANLIYAAPGVPFIPAIAIMINIYLVMNLSVLSLLRFALWMTVGLVVYFKYGIKNSTLETDPPRIEAPTPPPPNPLLRTTIPPPSPRSSRPKPDRNIFQGDGGESFFGSQDQPDRLAWHETDLRAVESTSGSSSDRMPYKVIESRYDTRTNATTSHTSSRPPWAYPDHESWDD